MASNIIGDLQRLEHVLEMINPFPKAGKFTYWMIVNPRINSV
jgi:hypothetical protein